LDQGAPPDIHGASLADLERREAYDVPSDRQEHAVLHNKITTQFEEDGIFGLGPTFNGSGL
jgi:hypothetical protein